jgi:ABC-2 type transport system permease protein
VADVAAAPGIGEQIGLVAGLRWRILRNQLRRKNARLDLIGMIWAGIFASLLVVGLSFAFYWGAYSFLSGGHSAWMAWLFWAIFIFWQVVHIFMAGFGATFEFRTLLRFPLNLGAFYLIALAYGFADFAAIASVSWLIAMTLGATAANPSVLPAMLLIVALFILMNVTLERLLASWLERLLARRRTRELLFGLFILLSVSLQFIRPLVERYQHGAPSSVLRFLPYLSVFPPGFAGRAIAAGAGHHLAGVLQGAAGLFVYALFFSVLLWQRFAAQYHGEELSESAAPARAAASTISRRPASPDVLELLSPQVAAIVRKDFRYLTRNSFVLVSLVMPPLLVLLFSYQFASKHPWIPGGVSPDLFFPGMMGYLMLMLMMPAYNCFAYEGHGIQTYFTAPLRFRDVFLGKNLVHALVLIFEVLVALGVLAMRVGLPSPPALTAVLAALVFAVTGQFSIANWASLSFPRKMEFGSLRGQRNSGVAVWVGFGAQIILAAICSLILLVGRWTASPWLPAEAFAVLAAAALGGYFASLDPLTQLAEKKKETLIEAFCK